MDEQQRSLKVILFSDVVDSTGRMFADEATTVRLIQRDLAVFEAQIAACGGALIKNTGDGILATFATTTQALDCLQNSLLALRHQEGPHLQHRFGMHIGEIYLRGHDIAGSGVNLAARLQTISPANGVAFTQGTYANLDSRFRHLALPHGLRELKGIPEKVRCYALHEDAFLAATDRLAARRLRSGWFRLRRQLNATTPAQAIAAGSLLVLALLSDLLPANPLNTYLLDRRLAFQKSWRQLTAQPGPRREAIPIVLLESREPLLPRQTLTQLLLQLPPERFPRLALDLVLDRDGPDPAATENLIGVIRKQQRRSLYVGYFGSQAQATDAGHRSEPIAPLKQAGVLPRDLSIGTAAGSGPVKPVPLQLLLPITQEHLAAAIANGGASSMPADSVIDWSLAWETMISLVTPADLQSASKPLVLVGRFDSSSTSEADLFRTPAAFYDPRPLWQGTAHEMPGVILQAVVGQSLRLRHWLTPLSSFFCVALAAGAGVLVAAVLPSVKRRLLLLVLLVPAGGLVSLQVAIATGVLIPIALPTLALASTGLLRRE